MAKRPGVSKYPGSAIAAGESDITVAAGSVELQLRTRVAPSPRWRTLRCVIGPGHGHYESLPPIEGDGTIAALRVVRKNDDGAEQSPKAWVEGFRR
jgi:hypothetical protein